MVEHVQGNRMVSVKSEVLKHIKQKSGQDNRIDRMFAAAALSSC